MADPLSDPRAAATAVRGHRRDGHPGGRVSHASPSQAQTAAAGLRGAQDDATWTGGAADAFRAQVGKLPGDLDKVQQSYGEVATALDTYGAELGPIQNQFRSLASELEERPIQPLGGAGPAVDGQEQSDRPRPRHRTRSPRPRRWSTPTTRSSRASGAVGRLQDQLSGLQSRGMALLDEFDTIRGHARSAVSSAAGIAPSQGWLSSMMHSIGNFVDGVAKGIGKSVWDLVSGKAVINFIEHPSWTTFGELAKDVAVTASLVAMVAAPFAAPEIAEGDAAAVGVDAAAGAADGADGASAFAQGARVVSDGANKVVTAGGLASSASDAEQGKWGEAAVDLAFTAGPNLGHMPTSLGDVKTFGDRFSNTLGVGERQAEAAHEGLESLEDFHSWRDVGLNPVAAKQLSFPDGEFPPSADSFDLSSQAGREAAIADAKALATKAAGRAIHVGRPVAIGFDNVIGDPSSEAIKHHVSPEPSCG